MASRINHAKAKLPPPNYELFGRMAAAGYMQTCEFSGREESTAFMHIPSEVQDHWRSIARAMYAVVAVTGGATVGVVPEPKDA